jgi:hypothetical protein
LTIVGAATKGFEPSHDPDRGASAERLKQTAPWLWLEGVISLQDIGHIRNAKKRQRIGNEREGFNLNQKTVERLRDVRGRMGVAHTHINDSSWIIGNAFLVSVKNPVYPLPLCNGLLRCCKTDEDGKR